jgi:wyosine [tRNA(Phe)-imidazoG37] synthetase (radical SAM superfamily)
LCCRCENQRKTHLIKENSDYLPSATPNLQRVYYLSWRRSIMTRRQAREQAFILLFEKSFNNETDIGEVIELAKEQRNLEEDDFVQKLVHTACENIEAIDEVIASNARGWKINAETSLCVTEDSVRTAAKVVDTFFVDVKDMDPKIYKAYTKRDNSRVIENLRLLADLVPSDRVVIRLPLIKGYNDDACREKSEAVLRKMGFTRFDRFDYVIK